MYTSTPSSSVLPALDAQNRSTSRSKHASLPTQAATSASHQRAKAVRLPTELQQLLTTTKNINDVFKILQVSREHRLRRLLRRFTNQIQFGCKNSYCDVPTCLSYRKRRSKVPVRPYNDVVARSLAWRCVEDYGIFTEVEASDPHLAVSPKRRNLTDLSGCTKRDGLCWSEPVIPWYQDPARHVRRKAENTIIPGTSAVNGLQHVQTQASFTNSKGRKDKEIPPPDNFELRQGNIHDKDGEKISQKQTSRDVLPGDHAIAHTWSVRTGAHKDPEQMGPEQVGDPASFCQVLFATEAIKSLDNQGLASASKSDSNCDHGDRGKQLVLTEDSAQASGSSVGQLFPVHIKTFRVLSLSAIQWLARTVTEHRDEPVSIDLKYDGMFPSLIDFADQSLHFCLSHPLRLMNSVQTWKITQPLNDTSEAPTKTSLKTPRRVGGAEDGFGSDDQLGQLPTTDEFRNAFRVLTEIQTAEDVMGYLFAALQYSYVLPPSFQRHLDGSQRIGSPRSSKTPDEPFVSDLQVARLCMIVMHAIGFLPDQTSLTVDRVLDWPTRLALRNTAQVFPHGRFPQGSGFRVRCKELLTDIDNEDNSLALRLLSSLTDIISHRLAVREIHIHSGKLSDELFGKENVVSLIIDSLRDILRKDEPRSKDMLMYVIDLMCVLLLKVWDRRPIVRRTSPVGGALQLLAGLFRSRVDLNIPAESFCFEFISDSFDDSKMPLEWLNFRENNQRIHILSYSFLFRTSRLVKYFRAINIENMRKAHEYAGTNYADAYLFLVKLAPTIPVYGAKELLAQTRPHMARYFALTIRRSNMVEDAINQIWRRQRQELLRPLKVTLGKEEGEDGLDHGGVQQEFFRIVFGEMLNVDYGMFAIDDRTRMTWFQPDSMEPLYKFEALGILMSLAVYNAVTLPVTFPLAFYRKLLGLKVKKLDHIEDGWPELVKGLRVLETWKEGDVGDVIARTYDFCYQAFGTYVTVNMAKVSRDATWPPQSSELAEPSKAVSIGGEGTTNGCSDEHPVEFVGDIGEAGPSSASLMVEEAPLVTNANRDAYIKDYIFWLVNKSVAPQFTAFSRGFHTCLDSTALSIFTPEALKCVVEGETEIDIDGLEATTTYDGYSVYDQTIVDFWCVVRDMSPTQHTQLLEFVTASDRIPISGVSSIVFMIQKNGEGDDRLPSSSTCYGRLLLPQYSARDIMREKLEKAIENSVGFGSL